MREIDNFFGQRDEPLRGCLLFLRDFIPSLNNNITEAWKYNMPFYCYKGKLFCYLWINKKTNQPYVGVVDGYKMNHPVLIADKRSRMKIIPLDAAEDIPVDVISEILQMAIEFHQTKK